MQNIIGQLIVFLAIFFWVFSIQAQKQYKILFFQCLANLAYTVSYFLLGVLDASSMNLISTIRCFVFYRENKKNKEIPLYYLIGFVSLLIIFGILNYKDLLSLIPIIITIFYTISSYVKNTKVLRIVFIVAAFIWIYYNFKVGAYACIVGNALEIISGTVALIRFNKK